MSERMTFSLDSELKERLEVLADKAGTSLSYVIRRCIDSSFEEVQNSLLPNKEAATPQ